MLSGQLILNSAGKIWQETEILKEYLLRMTLFISYLQKEDFTEYNCTAGNALGADYAIIKLQRKLELNFMNAFFWK